jgi:hypothetical protein
MKEDMALAVCYGYVGEVVQARSLRSNRCVFNGKIAGISWRYDALSMRLAIRQERVAEAWRGVVKKLHSSGRIRKTMVRRRRTEVQVRRRDLQILRLVSASRAADSCPLLLPTRVRIRLPSRVTSKSYQA